MRTPAGLAGFAGGLAVVFAAAFGAGRVVGPVAPAPAVGGFAVVMDGMR